MAGQAISSRASKQTLPAASMPPSPKKLPRMGSASAKL